MKYVVALVLALAASAASAGENDYSDPSVCALYDACATPAGQYCTTTCQEVAGANHCTTSCY